MTGRDKIAFNKVRFASSVAGVENTSTSAADFVVQPIGSGWARQVPGNGSPGRGRVFAAIDRRWVHFSYLLMDIIFISLNGILVFYLSSAPFLVWQARQTGSGQEFPGKAYAGFLMIYLALIILFCQSQDLYRTPRERSAAKESWAVLRAVSLATIIFVAFIFCSNVKLVSREMVGINTLLNVATLVMWRALKRGFVARRVAQGAAARNALIIGAGEVGRRLARCLEENKELGYRVTGFLDSDHPDDPRMLGRIENLAMVARRQFVDEIFVTTPSERDVVKNIALEARQLRLNVNVVLDQYDGLASNAQIHHAGEFPIMELHWESIPITGLLFKRFIDISVSGTALVLLSPLSALLGLAIKLDSPGPVLYRSKRTGEKGKTFTCYKFRTMVANAEELKEQVLHLNERSNHLLFKITNDPRVTRLGKFLRQYSMDELPQFWNVLKGEMSLVGPRPPLPTEFDQYSLEHLQRLDVKPGITGLWQVQARRDPSFDSYMSLDIEYIKNWSLWLDLKILLRTIPAMLRAEGN